MASLQFKGKQFVQNHHLVVPYHELIPRKEKSKTDKISLHDNLIIHGDNLLALKALLPTYSGKVKCIYIDPPYNTGNEGWVYSDNVNSPMMQEWLKVNKPIDNEDLTRHDKWLCMMTPRLKLLKELLTEDGVIFISIDDNEASHLKMLMDDIFGEVNFVAQITVENDSRARQYESIATTHEYVLVYAISLDLVPTELIDETKEFKYRDKDGGFDIYELRNRNIAFNIKNRPNLYYSFWVNPNKYDENGFYEISLNKHNGWKQIYPQESQGIKTVWRWAPTTAYQHLNTILFAKKTSGNNFQIIKKYRGKTRALNTVWTDKDVKTDRGTLELKEIFGKKVFDYPKPVALITRLISIISHSNDIILDSFAGSGTTAHAVLRLNVKEKEKMKFILVEMEDYANSITAERVRRVIKGYGDKEGLGGTFSYFDLGKPLEIESILSGNNLPSYKELARYVFYTATGEEFDENKINEDKNFVGESKEYEVFLLYKPDLEYLKSTALTLDRARLLGKINGKRRLVFAPTKYIDQDHLDELHIDFAQLPFEIYKLAK